jgi:hypothetical protein
MTKLVVQPQRFPELHCQPNPPEINITFETHLGVSENSVPLNPMVNDHYPY